MKRHSREQGLRLLVRGALSLGGWLVASAGATGVNGVVPRDGAVQSPSTGQVVDAWKQVGTCAASAVQISPSWVLSANHAHCSAGNRFVRQDGASELIDLEAPTQQDQEPLSNFDLHLARLVRPLPYPGAFVPLVEGIVASGVAGKAGSVYYGAKPSDACLATDILLAGYGQAQGGRVLRVGWSTFDPANWVFPDIDRDGNTNAGSTDGDSGGGAFLVNADHANGMLAGLMQVAAYGLGSTRGLPAAARAQIDAVLRDQNWNPSGEQIQWIDAVTAKGPLSKPAPINFRGTGGPLDSSSLGIYGVVTSQLTNAFRVQLPRPFSCADSTQFVDSAAGYQLQLALDNGSAGVVSRIVDTPPGSSRNPYVHDMPPGSIWHMLVYNKAVDPVSQRVEMSLVAPRTTFTLPEVLPLGFEHAEFQLSTRNRPGGLPWPDGKFHWLASITVGLPQSGPMPEGVYLFDNGRRVIEKIPFDSLYSATSDYTVKVLTDVSRSPAFQPGDMIDLVLYPYIGVGLGKPSFISFTAPASLP